MLCDIIKVKMRHNPAPAGYETYEFKMAIFNNGSPEELLWFLEKVNKSIKVTGTMTVVGIINFLRMLLHQEVLQ